MKFVVLFAVALGLASPVAGQSEQSAADPGTVPRLACTVPITRAPLQPTTHRYQWGLPGDLPMMGADFDGDCRPDLVVFRPSTGTWHIRTSSSGFAQTRTYQWGLLGDVPSVQDWDGDGHIDLTIYRPSSGEWFIRYWSAQGY